MKLAPLARKQLYGGKGTTYPSNVMREPALGVRGSETDESLESTSSYRLRADVHFPSQLGILLSNEILGFIRKLGLKPVLGVDDVLLDELHSVQLLLFLSTGSSLLFVNWVLLLKHGRLSNILSVGS